MASNNELEAGVEYIVAFYWNYGNAYPLEDFAISSWPHAAPYADYLQLTPMEYYNDAEGHKYLAKPTAYCLWQLGGNASSGWTLYNSERSKYLYSGTGRWDNGTSVSDNASATYTIDINNHRIGRKGNNNNPYLHFYNVNIQNPDNATFYMDQNTSPDKCYFYRNIGTVYSSWPHCEKFMVYFDGCDGKAEVWTKTEDVAGKGVVTPNVTETCQGDWQFAGWAAASVDEQTDAMTQDLYPVGTTYIPNKNNVTLYAVYHKPKNDFELVTSSTGLYLGRNYMVVANYNSRYYAMGNTQYSNAGRITSSNAVTINDNTITSNSAAYRWRLQGRDDFYQLFNPSAGTNGKFMEIRPNNYNYASLQDTTIDDCRIIDQGSARFYVNSNRSPSYYLTGNNNYFNTSTTSQYIYFFRQKADYWSYPCSTPVEPVCWGDGTVTVESLTLTGELKSGSVTITSIDDGPNGTYVINHTSRPGRRMRIKWGNNYYRLTVPYIASPTYTPTVENLPKYDLVIIPNAEFTVSLKTFLHTVSVYEDASLVIAQGDTLFVDTLYLRSNGPDHHPRVTFGGDEAAIVVNSGVIYHDHRFDDQAYYPLSVPYDANVSRVRYAGLISEEAIPVPAIGNNFWLKTYNGKLRAKDANDGVNMEDKTYWEHIVGNVMKGGAGYSIGLADNTVGDHKERTMRFRMAPNNGAKYIIASRDTAIEINPSLVPDPTKKHHSGWNWIGNPYIHTFYPGPVGEDAGLLSGHFEMGPDGKWQHITSENVPYLTFYNAADDDYYQMRADNSSMAPFSTAFIQVEDAEKDMLFYQTPMFADEAPSPVSARRAKSEENRIVKADLLLYDRSTLKSGTLAYDETGLVISNRYTNEYEVGADLVKMSNPRMLHVYTKNATHNLAFNALDEQTAAQPIPVGVSVPKTGSYTFLFDERQYDINALEALYLTDKQQGKTVDLLDEDYSCTIEKGVNEARFVLNVVLKPEKEDPTNMEAAMVNGLRVFTNTDGSITLYNSSNMTKVQVYDVAGRLLGEWKPNTYQWTVNLPQGVYAVSVQDAQNQITHVKICSK